MEAVEDNQLYLLVSHVGHRVTFGPHFKGRSALFAAYHRALTFNRINGKMCRSSHQTPVGPCMPGRRGQVRCRQVAEVPASVVVAPSSYGQATGGLCSI